MHACTGYVEGGGGSGGLERRERERGLCFACFWGFSAAPGAVYVREGKR